MNSNILSSRPWFLAGWLLLMAGCAGSFAAPETGDEKVRELERRNLELRQQAAVNEVELARLRQEVARLEAELATGSIRESERAIESPPILDEEPAQPIAPRTGIEVTDIEDTLLEEEVPEPTAPSAEPLPGPGVPVSPPPPGGGTETSADAQQLYDEGYTLFHQKLYADAEQRFERFLTLYATSDLADNAQFWIGESRYARGDFASALAAFSATVERFPGGNKVPDALVKAGKCLEALGDLERAKDTYNEVRARYPGTAAAVAAEERLEALR